MTGRTWISWHTILLLVANTKAMSVVAPPTTRAAMLEWMQVNDRLKTNSVELSLDGHEGSDHSSRKIVVTTTREVPRGEKLFRLTSDAIWSAADAYRDKDMGPKLRDLAGAGAGFGVVALSGALAAERVRRYRKVEGMGTAPESTGYSTPSKWGAFARWLWSSVNVGEGETADGGNINIDESLMGTVRQGVNLIVPMLDVAARRAWSSAIADNNLATVKTATFLSEEWAREAMFNDGSALSWSRGELESVATQSFGLVLQLQKAPPPFLLDGVGSLIPEPFVDSDESPESWPTIGGEPLALVPIVDDMCFCSDGEGDTNAVLGSPPRQVRREDQGADSLWCVATRDLKTGERILSSNPWVEV